MCFLAKSVGMGLLITFVYDFILIGRKLVRHNMAMVSLEDFLFWVFCAVAVFYMLYEENNGVLRWFAVLGAATGMLIYKKLAGRHFVAFISRIAERQMAVVSRICKHIFRPLYRQWRSVQKLEQKIGRRKQKLKKIMKKKLTDTGKLLKITISKH